MSKEKEIIKELKRLIKPGAPSEQEDIIHYGVDLWRGIHKIIDKYDCKKEKEVKQRAKK